MAGTPAECFALLDESQKELLLCLSLFERGWSPSLGRSMCGAETAEERRRYDADLERLVELDLVIQGGETNGDIRYSLAVEARDFALEELDRLARREELRLRHCECMVSFMEQVDKEASGIYQARSLARASQEHANLEAAWETAIDPKTAGTLAERLLLGCRRFWLITGRAHDGLRLTQRVIPRMMYPRARAMAHNLAGVLAGYLDQLEDARAHLMDALEEYQKLEDRIWVASVLCNLAINSRNLGELDRAIDEFSRATAAFRDLRDSRRLCQSLSGHAGVLLDRRRAEEALPLLREARRLALEMNDDWADAKTVFNLAKSELVLDHLQEADMLFKASLSKSRRINDPHDIASCLNGLAYSAMAQDRPERAAMLLGLAQEIRSSHLLTMPRFEKAQHEAAMLQLRDRMGDEAFAAAYAKGQRSAIDHLVEPNGYAAVFMPHQAKPGTVRG